jgi:hypothetical protein
MVHKARGPISTNLLTPCFVLRHRVAATLSCGGNTQKQETALTTFGLQSPQPFERAH